MAVTAPPPMASPPHEVLPGESPAQPVVENRSFLLTWAFSLVFGFLGLDRFYTGRHFTGALKLLSLGGLGIWWIVDLGIVLAGGLRYRRVQLRGYDASREIAWMVTGLTIIVAYSMQVDELISAVLTGMF